MNDWQLIDEFVARNSELAFRALVDRHVNLVHAAASRQVSDPGLAEEVTQAVFILFARKAPSLRRGVVVSGWLYRTTRFVAARALRDEQTRRKYEQEAAQMQQISTTDDDSAWRRLAPMLDEALEQLGETDRSAVILRYFQEKPLQQVGADLGISEEAARKRVDRSVDKLRVFFGRRGFAVSSASLATALAAHGSEAPAGIGGPVASAALAQAGSGAATLPALARETIKAWRWARIRLAAGLGAGVAAAGLAVFFALPKLGGSTAAPSPATPAADRATAPPAKADQSSSATAKEMPLQRSSGGFFDFQVVSAESGVPIAKARVLAVSAVDQDNIDSQTNLMTDTRGHCQIPLKYPNAKMLCAGVLADGYEQRCVMLGASGAIPASYVLQVRRGETIGGIVQDEAGNPVPDARVQVQFYGTGDHELREFQQERPGFPADDLAVAATDAFGHWAFASAPTNGGGYYIIVKHANYSEGSFQTEEDTHSLAFPNAPLKLADLQAQTAVLRLKAGLALRGTVSDDQQKPLAGATVRFGEFDSDGNPTARTASDGSFSLAGLSAGTGHLNVTAEGFAPERMPVDVGPGAIPLNIQLQRGRWLRVRVVDQSSNAVSHARVQLQAWRGNNSLDWGAFTDDDGRVLWTNAPSDQLDLCVLKEGYFPSRDAWITADDQEHYITVRPTVTVSGFVTDADTRQPVLDFKAIPGNEFTNWRRLSLAHGTNGSYLLVFDEYKPPFEVRFEAQGYEPAVSPPLPRNPTNQTFNIALHRQTQTNSIQGAVLLPDGTPAADVQVALATRDHGVSIGRGKFGSADETILGKTDASGHFSFPPALEAVRVAAISSAGFGTAAINPSNRSVSVQLQPWGRIEGVLKLRLQPNAGQQMVLVELPAANPRDRGGIALDFGSYSTQTDAQGNFVFTQTPAGEYDIYVNEGVGRPLSHQTRVQVRPGATTTVEVPGNGSIVTGKFVCADSSRAVNWARQLRFPVLGTKMDPVTPPPGLSAAEVAKWWSDYNQSDTAISRARAMRSLVLNVAADGSFSVEGVPPGDYQLTGMLFDPAADPSNPMMGDRKPMGSLRQTVEVPQPADGTAAQTVDLGAVTVQTW